MRLLLPDALDPVDPMDVYGDLPRPQGRPGLRLNMVASADGATAVDGRARGLAAESDRRLFRLIRSLADLILVGANTMRQEGYRPAAVPIAVVSRSCAFDWTSPFFQDTTVRPLVFTVARAPTDNLERTQEVADVVTAGEHTVDLAVVLDELGRRGFNDILSEGGPTLNAHLVEAGVLDELCLSISPLLVGGEARRVLAGPASWAAKELALVSLCEEEGTLFCRYRPAADALS